MIVVEGFDGSGKSTLARAIAEKLNYGLVHTGGPTKDVGDVMLCLNRSRQRMALKVVQDRITHVSEAVYSMIQAPKKAAPAIMALRQIHDGITMIYCRPPTEFLLEALKNEHIQKGYDSPQHMDHVLSNARQLIGIYDTIMEIVSHYTGLYTYDRSISGADEQMVETIVRRHRD